MRLDVATPQPSDAAIYVAAAEQLRAHADKAMKLANEMDPQPEPRPAVRTFSVGVYAYPHAGGPGYCWAQRLVLDGQERIVHSLPGIDPALYRAELHIGE